MAALLIICKSLFIIMQYYSIALFERLGTCDQCGMANVEVKTIHNGENGKTLTLCNQCRPADGAYAY